jgi:hypothetical protein
VPFTLGAFLLLSSLYQSAVEILADFVGHNFFMRKVIKLLLATIFISGICAPIPPAQAVPITCGGNILCNVGDTGPGGGIVFFTTNSPFACGPTLASWCNNLEAAPKTWAGGASDALKYWSLSGNVVPGIGQVSPPIMTAAQFGLGLKNSIAMAISDTTTGNAAVAARAYNGGGMTDWYLPTMAELRMLCQWAHGDTITVSTACSYTNALNTGVPLAYAFTAGSYQSSTQSTNPGSAQWHENFTYQADNNTAEQSTWEYTSTTFYTRPIRAFITGSATISLNNISTSAIKGGSINIVATVSTAGVVRFYANGKRIPKCLAVATVTSGTITATCQWKPSVQGSTKLTATITPTISAFPATTSDVALVSVPRRTTTR